MCKAPMAIESLLKIQATQLRTTLGIIPYYITIRCSKRSPKPDQVSAVFKAFPRTCRVPTAHVGGGCNLRLLGRGWRRPSYFTTTSALFLEYNVTSGIIFLLKQVSQCSIKALSYHVPASS